MRSRRPADRPLHPAVSRARGHPDLVRRSLHLRSRAGRIQARLLPRHRRIPHLGQGGRRRMGEEDRRFRRQPTTSICTPMPMTIAVEILMRHNPTAPHHLGPYRLWAFDRPRGGDADEISKAVGRTVLPRRHRRRRRQADGGMARAVRALSRTASCSAPIPGSTSAGQSYGEIMAGYRAWLSAAAAGDRGADRAMAMRGRCSARGSGRRTQPRKVAQRYAKRSR